MYRLTMPGAVFSGEEALSSIQSLVSAGDHICMLTDPGIVRAGVADRVLAALKHAGAQVRVMDQVPAEPAYEDVQRLATDVSAGGLQRLGSRWRRQRDGHGQAVLHHCRWRRNGQGFAAVAQQGKENLAHHHGAYHRRHRRGSYAQRHRCRSRAAGEGGHRESANDSGRRYFGPRNDPQPACRYRRGDRRGRSVPRD